MSLTIKEFDINELRAGLGKPLHGTRLVNSYYGDDHRRVPNIRVYRGMNVRKGKFGKFFELDIKDDESEEFFKSLREQLRILAGGCLDEKPWNLKSPIIEYGPYYSVHCKIYSKFTTGQLEGRRIFFHGYCEIRPYHAFCGKAKGITLAVNKVLR